MTYMCNKCMGNLLNVRSRGKGAGGGGRSEARTHSATFYIFFDIITVNSLRGTPSKLRLSVYLRKMFIVHV